jgi:hypothetical protein
MDLQGVEQRRESFALGLVESRPCQGLLDELYAPITDPHAR